MDYRRAKCAHLPVALETHDDGGDRGMVSEGLISDAYPWKALAGWSYHGMIRKCLLKSSELER